MTLEELKKRREQNFLTHKKKKKAYYLKNKIKKTIIDYDLELNGEDFFKNIKKIAHSQKLYLDSRKDKILEKLNEYKNLKKEYYEQNKEKRLEYNKEYREKKRRTQRV